MKTGCPDPALDGSVTRFPARTSGAWAGALGVCVRGGRAGPARRKLRFPPGPPSAPAAPAWICAAASADRCLRLCDDKGSLRWPALPWPPPSQAHPVPGPRRFCKRDPDGPSPLCGPARMLRRSCGKEVRPEDGLCSIALCRATALLL